MRVLIADDHTLVRAGVRRLLESFSGVAVAGEAASGEQTLELAAVERPDLVLLDLSMPGIGGMEVIGRLREQLPACAVLVMSMHTDVGRVRDALDRGARGFLVKDAAVAELELALRAVAAGQTFLSPQISGRMLDSLMGRAEAGNPVDALPPRQRQILEMLGHGRTNREIAEQLAISVKTVETHRARMMAALGCERAPDLLRLAMRHVEGLPS
ncbi:MAG: response regulator [Lysobacteraceae bacterium]